MIAQAAIAIPVTAGLALYTLLRPDRTPLHVLMGATLGSVVLWMSALMVGLVADPAEDIRAIAFHFETLAIATMGPLFLTTIGRFARSPVFEKPLAAAVSLGAVSTLLYAGYLTNGSHHLFLNDLEAALRNEHPREWGGPIYWALQVWGFVCSFVGMGFVVAAALRGRTRSERRRALTLLGAIMTPIVAHLVFLTQWLPIPFSLATGAMAPCAFFFIRGVTHYGLLVVQPIVRQDVIEHFHDGIILADVDGVILDANHSAEDALHVAPGALRGCTLEDAFAGFDGPASTGVDGAPLAPLGARIASLSWRGKRFHEEVRTPDGRAVEVTAGAVSAIGTQPAGRFVALRDRSEQRRSERLLQDRQRLESVGILAAGVAHEVNNPLAYVRSNLAHLQKIVAAVEKELAIERGGPGEAFLELPEVLAESLEGLDRIGRIVDGMLHFSRLPEDAGIDVSVAKLIDDALRLGALHRNREVQVVQRLEPDLPTLTGSPQRLVQVLLNLLLNAKQALSGRSDGRIVVDAHRDGGHVEILVSDNGPGISAKSRAQIFEPFFTTRPPGEGTGLGLSIASDIVHEHGGTLECTSESGGGADFSMRLPIPGSR